MDQEQSTIITMFIHHLQTKGLWPCFMQVSEEPQPIDHNELFKLRDEFIGRFDEGDPSGHWDSSKHGTGPLTGDY